MYFEKSSLGRVWETNRRMQKRTWKHSCSRLEGGLGLARAVALGWRELGDNGREVEDKSLRLLVGWTTAI